MIVISSDLPPEARWNAAGGYSTERSGYKRFDNPGWP